jgi:hypothetical protein
MSGDELYANGQPHLLLVGNDSLYIYALSRQPDCDGESWGCTLVDGPECPQFASATSPKRLQQHLTQGDQLNQIAAEKVAQAEAFAGIAWQGDA